MRYTKTSSLKPQRTQIALGFLAISLLGSACSHQPSAEERLGKSAAPIENGTPVNPTDQPAAAFITLLWQDGATAHCSGTLIAPDLVLTAAHCARVRDERHRAVHG